MSAEQLLESVRRVELLRAELDRSLKLVTAAECPSPESAAVSEKRPLCILFQSAGSANIQISGAAHAGSDHFSSARPPQSPTSRFTVSPTPNAVPAMTEQKRSHPPLCVLTDRAPDNGTGDQLRRGGTASDSIPAPVSASSPASSVDSGVASPGGDFLLLACSPPSSPFPAWGTVPRTAKQRVFNFTNSKRANNQSSSNNGSLIEALALSAQTPLEMMPTAVVALQKPPPGKKHGPPPLTNAKPSQPTDDDNGYFSSSASTIITSSSPSTPHSAMPPVQQISANATGAMVPPSAVLRQMSEGSAQLADQLVGLPPRAATMPPLKSILKKPRGNGVEQGFGPAATESALPRNHLRRMPTRFVLGRSVSESLLDQEGGHFAASPFQANISAAATFNASVLSKLCSPTTLPQLLDAFDEQLEEEATAADEMEEASAARQCNSGSASGTSSPSSCSSEFIDSDGSAGQMAGALCLSKKRVSFSEHVQARIYRSNSSILGQRRKNEKKAARQRTSRRCNSEGGHSDEPGVELHCQQQQKSAPAVCRSRDLPPVFPAAHQTANSGFSVMAQ